MRFPAVETADDLLPKHGHQGGVGGLTIRSASSESSLPVSWRRASNR